MKWVIKFMEGRYLQNDSVGELMMWIDEFYTIKYAGSVSESPRTNISISQETHAQQ